MPGGPKELDEAFDHLRKNPSRSLEICQRYVNDHPYDANGYYSRFNAWDALGEYDMALTDISRVLELDPNMGGYASRGKFFRRTGDYQRSVEDLTRARELDEAGWKTFLYPLERADCYARLGHLDEALADCVHIPDDWWMPSIDGLPGGNKQEIVNEIKRRALEARRSTRS